VSGRGGSALDLVGVGGSGPGGRDAELVRLRPLVAVLDQDPEDVEGFLAEVEEGKEVLSTS